MRHAPRAREGSGGLPLGQRLELGAAWLGIAESHLEFANKECDALGSHCTVQYIGHHDVRHAGGDLGPRMSVGAQLRQLLQQPVHTSTELKTV